MFDSNANRGRLIDTDWSMIESGAEFLVDPFVTPWLDVCPLANITFPPSEIISDTAAETSVIFPFSLSMIKPIFGTGVICV